MRTIEQRVEYKSSTSDLAWKEGQQVDGTLYKPKPVSQRRPHCVYLLYVHATTQVNN